MVYRIHLNHPLETQIAPVFLIFQALDIEWTYLRYGL
jgi:hypothetical protein